MSESEIWHYRWLATVWLGFFLGALTLIVIGLFVWMMFDSRGKPGIWVETNWGGLGGGLSGWRVSPAISFLLLTALLLGCLSLTVVALPGLPEKKADSKKEETPKTEATKKEEPKKEEQKEASKTEGDKAGKKDNVPAAGK